MAYHVRWAWPRTHDGEARIQLQRTSYTIINSKQRVLTLKTELIMKPPATGASSLQLRPCVLRNSVVQPASIDNTQNTNNFSINLYQEKRSLCTYHSTPRRTFANIYLCIRITVLRTLQLPSPQCDCIDVALCQKL